MKPIPWGIGFLAVEKCKELSDWEVDWFQKEKQAEQDQKNDYHDQRGIDCWGRRFWVAS